MGGYETFLKYNLEQKYNNQTQTYLSNHINQN